MKLGAALVSSSLIAALAACAGGAKPSAVRSQRVTKGALAEVVSATGEVSALVTVNVGTQVSGTLSKLHVDFNSAVKKGQVLAELDPRLFEAALGKAQAGLTAARADALRAKVALVDAKRTEDRTAKLLEKSLVAAADLDAATAAREAAEAALQAAEARVGQARADEAAAATNVALCRITSPIDGVVISRAVDVGQTVAASLQAPTLFLIANDLSRMQILAAVDEADVGKVKDGLAARFTVDAFPGEVFKGRIREVRQAPTNIQNVVTYAAVIDAPNPDRKLRQGMTAAVTIVTNQRDGALRIPNTALRFRPAADREGVDAIAGAAPGRAEAADRPHAKGADATATGRPGVRKVDVYQLEGGRPVRAAILVGITDGRATEVVSGLAEGDEVAVGEATALAAAGGKRGPF
ncbi:MAG TPA: efflux RND transporter periplasmic adaptor subunit [Anaeromyxobacteraceae bacterium]|nr:efflux RND transporter periplasmic adaptor subunit [Anaeromyxobacteraceae bacterium]